MSSILEFLLTLPVAMILIISVAYFSSWFFRKTGIRGFGAVLVTVIGGGVLSGLTSTVVTALLPAYGDFLGRTVLLGLVTGTVFGSLNAIHRRERQS